MRVFLPWRCINSMINKVILSGLLLTGGLCAQDTWGFLNVGIGPTGFNREINYARYTNLLKLWEDTTYTFKPGSETGYETVIESQLRASIQSYI